jgi:hypothetical protein
MAFPKHFQGRIIPVGNNKSPHGYNKQPGLEVMPLPEERDDDRDVSLDGEGHGRVDGSRERHLRDRHQVGSQVSKDVICKRKTDTLGDLA